MSNTFNIIQTLTTRAIYGNPLFHFTLKYCKREFLIFGGMIFISLALGNVKFLFQIEHSEDYGNYKNQFENLICNNTVFRDDSSCKYFINQRMSVLMYLCVRLCCIHTYTSIHTHIPENTHRHVHNTQRHTQRDTDRCPRPTSC